MQINQNPYSCYSSRNSNPNNIHFKSFNGDAYKIVEEYARHKKHAPANELSNSLDNIYLMMKQLFFIVKNGKIGVFEDKNAVLETYNPGDYIVIKSIFKDVVELGSEISKRVNADGEKLSPESMNKLMDNVFFRELYNSEVQKNPELARQFEIGTRTDINELDVLKQRKEKVKRERQIDGDLKTLIESKIGTILECASDTRYLISREKGVNIDVQELKPEIKRKRKQYLEQAGLDINNAYKAIFYPYIEKTNLLAEKCTFENRVKIHSQLKEKLHNIDSMVSLIDERLLTKNSDKKVNIKLESSTNKSEKVSSESQEKQSKYSKSSIEKRLHPKTSVKKNTNKRLGSILDVNEKEDESFGMLKSIAYKLINLNEAISKNKFIGDYNKVESVKILEHINSIYDKHPEHADTEIREALNKSLYS